MFSSSRRAFLGASVAGLSAGPFLHAVDPVPVPKSIEDAAFQPSTLFLT